MSSIYRKLIEELSDQSDLSDDDDSALADLGPGVSVDSEADVSAEPLQSFNQSIPANYVCACKVYFGIDMHLVNVHGT